MYPSMLSQTESHSSNPQRLPSSPKAQLVYMKFVKVCATPSVNKMTLGHSLKQHCKNQVTDAKFY